MMDDPAREARDDFNRTKLNALSRFGFTLGVVSMVTLGLRWVMDVPSGVELTALVLLFFAVSFVAVGVVIEAHRSGFSLLRMLRLFGRAVAALFVSLRSWFLP